MQSFKMVLTLQLSRLSGCLPKFFFKQRLLFHSVSPSVSQIIKLQKWTIKSKRKKYRKKIVDAQQTNLVLLNIAILVLTFTRKV